MATPNRHGRTLMNKSLHCPRSARGGGCFLTPLGVPPWSHGREPGPLRGTWPLTSHPRSHPHLVPLFLQPAEPLPKTGTFPAVPPARCALLHLHPRPAPSPPGPSSDVASLETFSNPFLKWPPCNSQFHLTFPPLNTICNYFTYCSRSLTRP